MTTERKAFGVIDLELKAVADDGGDPNGTFSAVLSKDSFDRDEEIVDSKAFEADVPLPSTITIDTDHSLTIDSVVGSGVPTYEADGSLTVSGTYSSIARAQEVRTLVNEGHVKAMSVTFINGRREKDAKGVTHVRGAELVNATFCVAGVNRDALVLASKALSTKAGARNSSKDQEHIQSAHDHMVSAGADCSGSKSIKALRVTGGTKALTVPGSYEDRQEDIVEAIVTANASTLTASYPYRDPGDFSYMVQIVATFDDRVIYRIGWGDEDDAYQATYTWDGEAATLGDSTPVTLDIAVDAPEEPSTASAVKAVAAGDLQAGDEDMAVRARALHLAALAAI